MSALWSSLTSMFRPKASAAGDPAGTWQIVGGDSSGGGYLVSERDIRCITTAYACKNLIARDIAAMPFGLLKREDRKMKDGAVRPMRTEVDDPLAFVLGTQFNPYLTACMGWQLMIRWALGFRAYAEIIRDKSGTVRQLWPIHPSRMWLKPNQDLDADTPLMYEIRLNNGRSRDISERKLFILYDTTDNGRTAQSVDAMMQNALDTRLQIDRHVRHCTHNKAMPAMVAEADQFVSKEVRDAWKQELANLYTGPENSGKTLLATGGIKIKQMAWSLKELEITGIQQSSDLELCRWFAIPPQMVGIPTQAQGWSSLAALEASYVNSALCPRIKLFEQEIRRQLMGDYPANVEPHFETFGRLKGDIQTLSDVLNKGIGSGQYTPNEARALRNMNPIDDPMADQLFIQQAFVPLSMTGELAKAGASKPTPGQSGDNQHVNGTSNGTAKRGLALLLERNGSQNND